MESQESKKQIKLQDLPPHLQKKYKNSILFEKENLMNKAKKYHFDIQKIKQRKAEKEKTIQQKLQQYQINPTQQKYLLRVFNDLSSPNKGQFFTRKQISQVLKKMSIKMTNTEIDRMIWQFDEKLNKKISYKEFANMYKKCTIDKTAAESKNLFHLTQFLMFCRPDYYKITVEDTLELLYVRAKMEADATKGDERQLLDDEIRVIFGNQEKTPDGVQKQIGFAEYMEKINKRAIEKRKEELIKAKSKVKY